MKIMIIVLKIRKEIPSGVNLSNTTHENPRSLIKYPTWGFLIGICLRGGSNLPCVNKTLHWRILKSSRDVHLLNGDGLVATPAVLQRWGCLATDESEWGDPGCDLGRRNTRRKSFVWSVLPAFGGTPQGEILIERMVKAWDQNARFPS